MVDDIVEQRLRQLEFSVSEIRARNGRVELEKAWEQSRTRVVSIVIITYLLMSLVFWLIGNQMFLINALIPTLGYFISTQSLSFIKQRWGDKWGQSQ